MSLSRDRSFMFCPLCGAMLVFKNKRYVECPLCDFKRNAKEVLGREVLVYRGTGEDVRRELGISTFDAGVIELPKMTRRCETCNMDTEWEYYSRQMRSADEGQTTFYKCTKCGDQFTEN